MSNLGPPTAPAPDAGPNSELGFVARYRTLIAMGVHAVLFALALLAAFGIAYNFRSVFPSQEISLEGRIARTGGWLLWLYLPCLVVALPLKLVAFGLCRQYRGSWRYVGLRDLLGVAVASYVGSFLFMVAFFVVGVTARPWVDYLVDNCGVAFRQGAVFLSDMVATIGLVALTRVVWRLYHEEVRRSPDGAQGRRLLIVGAGRVGETVLREIIGAGEPHEVVGFLDDDPARWKNSIHGVDVLGATSEIREFAEAKEVEEILIALPKAPPREIRRIVESCAGTNLRFRTIPALGDLIEGRVAVSEIRNVDIEDLLGRDPVELDTQAIGEVLAGKTIGITGAGGSIGSEMCRQIARFSPGRLILVEQAENNLFEIDRELRRSYPDLDIVPVVADICDRARLQSVFRRERPAAVFHAAAHKHVPLMEINTGEAVKNNVQGTRTVADAAVDAGVEKVVMISTDKAVNPTSIMGCTKRVAELYVQQLSARSSTQFVTVRFGNVLGSSGSVIPIFEKQIAEGGPVTVTHPDMQRYFMTIPEAAQLVLQAGAMGHGGEIYVLDMGDPVKIVDLARDMITLSGLRPGVDIDVEFTGVRPGEKLFEELSVVGEDMGATGHPKIYTWRHRPEDWDRLCKGIDRLLSLADVADRSEIVAQLAAIVPEYQPGNRAGTASGASPSPAPQDASTTKSA